MWLPTKAQVDAASRHAITAAGVAVTIFGLQAKGVSMEQVTSLINSLGSTINTLVQLLGAAAVVYGGIKAANSASPSNQIANTAAIAADPTQPQSVQAQAALVNATAAIASNNVPKSEEAKQTLIAATIALPEVQTIVTDKATAAAAPSESVVAAEEVKIVSTK